MPDATNDRQVPSATPMSWDEAFGRLPGESAPVDAWRRVAASLDAGTGGRSPTSHPERRRIGGWLALAATLALAVALPWQRTSPPTDTATGSTAATAASAEEPAPAAAPTLAELHAESALLETLLSHARDGRVTSGSAAAMTADLEARLGAIDAALAQPALAPAREHALWAERVQALRALASFEGTRRWLAANGEHYDGVLVQVN